MMKYLHNIRIQVLLALLLASVLPLLFMGSYALTANTETLREHAIQQQKSKLSLVNEQIQMFFQGVQGDLFYLRDSNDVGLYLAALNKGEDNTRQLMLTNLRNSFRQFSQNRGIYDQVRLIDNSGMEIVRVQLTNDNAEIIPENKLLNKMSRYFVTESLKQPEGGLYISPLDLKEKSPGVLEDPPRPSIRYGTSLFDSTKKQQGMILLNTNGNKVIDLLASAQSDDQKLFFVSPDGFYFYNPDSTKMWGGPKDLKTGFNLFQDYPELKDRLGKESAPAFFEAGDNFISSFPVKLNNGKETIGTLVAVASDDVVFASVSSSLWRFIMITLVILVLAGFLAFWLSRRISQPLEQLTDAVENLSQGDMDTPVSVKGYDKTEALSSAIERLRKSLIIFARRAGKATGSGQS